MSHFSWETENICDINIDEQVSILQTKCKLSSSASSYQFDLIPVYDVNDLDLSSSTVQKDIYDSFFKNSGALIIKNAFDNDTMEQYNSWSEHFLEDAKQDGNARHPKQSGKYLINDILSRMSQSDPELLLKLINNSHLTSFTDILLGFSKIGSCTGHWIEPGGDRQLSHVDFPIHIGSSPFWKESVDFMKSIVTKDQINDILPSYSLQSLIASDKMDVTNGSTEIVPCSHLIDNLDVIIHNKDIYKQFEKHFVNVSLEQGDVLIFNRRLCHRGGKNISSKRRNSLITQHVWLWGIGQEVIDSISVIQNLEKTEIYNQMEQEEKEKLLLRLQHPYPKNVKEST
jgi:hypothetical protein